MPIPTLLPPPLSPEGENSLFPPSSSFPYIWRKEKEEAKEAPIKVARGIRFGTGSKGGRKKEEEVGSKRGSSRRNM